MKLNEGDERYRRDCVIYKILCPNGLPIYIGHTTQRLSYRFDQHRTGAISATNPKNVANFLRKNPGCTMVWVQDAHCENLQAALLIETAVIAQFIHAKAKLLNVNQRPKGEKKKPSAQSHKIAVHKIITRKQTCVDDGHRFRVSAASSVDGKRHEFQYGPKVTREQAATKAAACSRAHPTLK
ncbi:hypothetical protein B484DRAFT_438854 [Ochromonadaceae sp. CCMP2298]|nr:hypothetical protein B484DRAFT_438854 [Ochromonadaceae sp. CCMP2298]